MPGLKVDSNDAGAGQRARFDMFNAAGQRELPFEAAGDIGLDLFRRHAVVERRDHHHRDVDVRKHVDRHAHQRRAANHCDDQRDDDDEVRVFELRI